MFGLKKREEKLKRIGEEWDRTELEFLPAALEIVETPPAPLGRALLWIIVFFFLSALAWSIIGTVDEVAVAPGKVIPSGYTKVVQANDSGIVRRLNVSNGMPVRWRRNGTEKTSRPPGERGIRRSSSTSRSSQRRGGANFGRRSVH